MPLEKWQERLEEHFASLARMRSGSGFPISALEHPLNNDEVEELSSLLRSRLKGGLTLTPHWLAWVVYATERGYSYAGDEYWQSFEEQTPEWGPDDHYKIRPWFSQFCKAYDGVVPSGTWATHFSIIAWPITHAILPRYLQRQFSRALYDLRFRLASLGATDPVTIGRLLATSVHATTRFEQFLQQEELTGRIVLALLGKDPPVGQEPIYPPTLRRIITDLEQMRNAREWLRETQRVVTDRFRGIGRGADTPTQQLSFDQLLSDRQGHLNLRPNLFLRYAGDGSWSLGIDVPDFRSVAALSAEIRTFLRNTRCRLSGSDDVKPAGWLLSGSRKAILKYWPDEQEPLVKLERSLGRFDHLLQSECRLDFGPYWLFRIGPDGIAREIKGRIVRPNNQYIVLTTADVPDAHICMSSCAIECLGISAFQIKIPQDASADLTAWLQPFGIQVARTIRVWPAGMPGRGWDGEGSGEWLTTESPCFGIVHDHPIDCYTLHLNGASETVVRASGVGRPTFVCIPPLPAGLHVLKVRARRSRSLDAVTTAAQAEGVVVLKVREPEPWIPGTSSHSGMVVTLDPHDASLDTFWDNRVALSVLGPESHQVNCRVSLSKGANEEIFSEQIDHFFDLPVTPETWKKKFETFVKPDDYAWRYLEATEGNLVIWGEELGKYVLSFERNASPVRWVLRNNRHSITIRLIDDTGSKKDKLTSVFFGMDHPVKTIRLTRDKALSGFELRPPGGLFFAKKKGHRDALVVSAGLTDSGFQGLGVKPLTREIAEGEVSLRRACQTLKLWRKARLAGFLADIRRRQTANAITAAIFKELCGTKWARAEENFLKNPKSTRTILELKRNVDRKVNFAAALHLNRTKMKNSFSSASQWYGELAARYGVCKDQEIVDFALRLASKPYRLPSHFGLQLDDLFNQIGENPTVLRGARFLALLSANENRAGSSRLLPRWKW